MYERVYALIGRERALPVYLTGAGRESQNLVRRPNGVGDFQILFSASGTGELQCAGRHFTAKPGTVFFLFPETPHEYGPVDGNWETDWVLFSGAAARSLAAGLGLSPADGPFPIPDPARLTGLFPELIRLTRAGGVENGQRCSALVYSLLVNLAGYRARAQENSADAPERLAPALRLIDRSYAEPLTLTDLSRAAGVTPQYLCRLFQRALGMRPFAYLTQRRVQAAKRLLTETDAAVGEVALRAGFSCANYFCAVFRHSEGIPPEEFRRRHGVL